MSSAEDVLRDLSAALAALGLRWFVFGAQAANIYAAPRATADIDVTVSPPADMRTLIAQLTDAGFRVAVDDPSVFDEFAAVLPLVHTASGVPVDMVVGRSGLEAEFLSRSIPTELSTQLTVPIISPEDLVISKVLAGRPKDIDDARRVFEAVENIDHQRILGVLSLLEEALDQSDFVNMVTGWTNG